MLPVIDVKDTKKITAAIENGQAFYLKSGNRRYKAVNDGEDEELNSAQQEILNILKEAENCVEYVNRGEFWSGAEK